MGVKGLSRSSRMYTYRGVVAILVLSFVCTEPIEKPVFRHNSYYKCQALK